ncbi:WD40 repeat domain-containing serine/threonine protein kinase [Actinomadura viridis]|uniref:WD40 repeat domain-containing serine/threonine protein kinase n=1 Tax=Actinomadura viridis TaxID=58110 RepID=UPI0036A161CA
MDPLRRGDPAQVGPYRIEARLGEGGMGRVYLGGSPGGRRVAVKVIRAEHAADVRFRARFAREVDAARRVGGFHTAQVIDADAEAEAPWMATAYVPGPSLRDQVTGAGPLAPDAVRRLGAALAEGLAAIHASGLVHRDLKPGNVIMSPDGPRIIDFGVARAADAEPLTSDGAVLGTYAFMAPEQMRGEQAGPAADVFALGCVLAYAATGRGPFDASSVPAIVHRVLNEEPLLNGIPVDLARAIAACLAKDPGARPAVPLLIAHLGSSRPGSPPGPAVPLPAAGPPAAPPMTKVATTAAGGAPGGTGTRRVPRRAVLAGALAAVTATAAGGGAVLAVRRRERPHEPGPAPAAQLAPAATLTGHTSGVDAIAFSPDGRLLATGSSDDDATRLWDVAAARPLRTLEADGVRGTAFSPDGRLLATAHTEPYAAIWDVASGRRIRTFRGGDRYSFWAVAFSPDGRTLATGSPDVRLWDLQSGRATVIDEGSFTRNMHGPLPNQVLGLRFSPDGRTLAAAYDGYGDDGDDRGALVIWEVASGRRAAVLRGPTDENMSLAFSPDGAAIAVCGGGDDITLWDVAGRRITAALAGHTDEVRSLAYDRKGTLASCGVDRTVRLWDVAARRTTAVLTGHTELLDAVALSPDGRTVAAGGGRDDNAVRLWKVR